MKQLADAAMKTYKVTIGLTQLDKVLSPKFQPEGVACRRFYINRQHRDNVHVQNTRTIPKWREEW